MQTVGHFTADMHTTEELSFTQKKMGQKLKSLCWPLGWQKIISNLWIVSDARNHFLLCINTSTSSYCALIPGQYTID